MFRIRSCMYRIFFSKYLLMKKNHAIAFKMQRKHSSWCNIRSSRIDFLKIKSVCVWFLQKKRTRVFFHDIEQFFWMKFSCKRKTPSKIERLKKKNTLSKAALSRLNFITEFHSVEFSHLEGIPIPAPHLFHALLNSLFTCQSLRPCQQLS